jgi:beta-methylarginine biosynthesis bifunctional aminotransferase
MHSLLEELSKRKISLVLDLVYDSFIFNDERIISPFVCTASWSDIYTINSISKNYGAPGLRIGWITSAAKNILQLSGDLEKECVSVCTPAQTKAAQLIQAGNTPLLDSVIKTRKIVRSKLVEGGLIKAFPTAGTQVFVDLQFENVEDYADFALVQYGLVLATSSNYTGTKNSYVRIPTSYPSCITELAMNKLLKSLKEYECNCNYVKSY